MPNILEPTIEKQLLEDITTHYLACLLWIMPGDDDNENPGDDISVHELSPDVWRVARNDCEQFCIACGPLFTDAMKRTGYGPEQWGHDFVLTRNGHGTGFWDRDALGDMGRTISDKCGWRTPWPEKNLVIGADGAVYFDNMSLQTY